ncbi:hypothetical protein [uncultured Mediterranean phage uvMED]|nr:hypothetical protein [uncultured Mediterranean phage uvMED]BAR22531.1 hypothetical protein [uncultured Mediterranean phage uvMED]
MSHYAYKVSIRYTWKRNTINCLFNEAPGNVLRFGSVEDFNKFFKRNGQFVDIHEITHYQPKPKKK